MINFVDDFLEYISLERKYSVHTVESYSFDLRLFTSFLNDEYPLCDLDKVNFHHVRAWVVFLSHNGDKNRTINRRISTLRSFYRYLLRSGAVDESPVVKMKELKIHKKIEPVYAQKEMQLLFKSNSCDQIDFSQFRDVFMVEFFYSTGLRTSELINLKISDIDLVKREIQVLGKGSKQRIIPLFNTVYRALLNYFYKRKEMYPDNNRELFLTDKGRKMYPKYVYTKVHELLNQVTTKQKKSPHMLRHTFATHLVNEGSDLNSIKELLGHSSIASTQVYINSEIEKLKNKYNKAHPRASK